MAGAESGTLAIMAGDLADAMHSDTPMALRGLELLRLYSTQGYGKMDPANLIRCYRDEKGAE